MPAPAAVEVSGSKSAEALPVDDELEIAVVLVLVAVDDCMGTSSIIDSCSFRVSIVSARFTRHDLVSMAPAEVVEAAAAAVGMSRAFEPLCVVGVGSGARRRSSGGFELPFA